MVAGIRIVPAEIAHLASRAQPCSSRQRFPGDEVDAACRLQVGDHETVEWHEDKTRSRRWRQAGRDVEGMVKPGTPPLVTA